MSHKFKVLTKVAVCLLSCLSNSEILLSQISQPHQVSLGASNMQVVYLTGANQVTSGTIRVDSSPFVAVSFDTSVKTLRVQITSPSGSTYTAGDPDTPTVQSAITPDPSDPNSIGSTFLFNLINPTAGDWTYRLTKNASVPATKAVLITMTSSSPVQGALLLGSREVRADRDTTLGLVVLDGNTPIKGLSISPTLKSSTVGALPAITFLDDGLGNDAVGGDGVYSATIALPNIGDYVLGVLVSGTSGTGGAFQRTFSTNFSVVSARATLAFSFTDRGIDANGDGLFEQIGVSPAFTVTQVGDYNVYVKLRATNGKELSANKIVSLQTTSTSAEVLFNAEDLLSVLGVGGPYAVAEVRLEFLSSTGAQFADQAFNLGSTGSYLLSKLQRDPILILSGGTATPKDTNANGKFDTLEVKLPIDLIVGGSYTWSGRLVDSNGKEVSLAGSSSSLSPGQSFITLSFAGSDIGKNCISGPFQIRNVLVIGASATGNATNPLTTTPLDATSFENAQCILANPTSIALAVGSTSRSIALTSSAGALTYSVSAATSSGGNWLQVSPISGSTPGTLSVTSNGSALPSGQYTGSITITSSVSGSSPLVIPITFSVAANAPINPVITPQQLSFQAARNVVPASQSLFISGSGTYNLSTSSSPAGWLRVSSIAGALPASINVTVDPTGLAPGAYTGSISIIIGSTTTSVTVAYSVQESNTANQLQVESTFYESTWIQGDTVPSVRVNVTSSGNVASFTSIVVGGQPWLTVPKTGQTPGVLQIIFSPGSLQPGIYESIVFLLSSQADSTSFRVRLTVLPSVRIITSPDLLTISGSTGGKPVEAVLYATATGRQINYNATPNSIGNWLTISNSNGSTPVNIKVSANPLGLPVGTHEGTITIQDDDGRAAAFVVRVQFIVTAATTPTLQFRGGKQNSKTDAEEKAARENRL